MRLTMTVSPCPLLRAREESVRRGGEARGGGECQRMSWTTGKDQGDGPGERVRLRICRHRCVMMNGTALQKL